MEGEWSRYRSQWRENGHATEVVSSGMENGHVKVVSLMEGGWACYRAGQFNGRMVMLLRWSLMEGKWSCYRSGH